MYSIFLQLWGSIKHLCIIFVNFIDAGEINANRYKAGYVILGYNKTLQIKRTIRP